MKKVRSFFRKKDVVLIILIFVVLIFSILVSEKKGSKVVVQGKDFRKILSKPGTYDITENGRFLMKVEFHGNRVRVVESTCPLKLCVKTGWVGPGGPIICVPNEVIIFFEEKTDYDTVTW